MGNVCKCQAKNGEIYIYIYIMIIIIIIFIFFNISLDNGINNNYSCSTAHRGVAEVSKIGNYRRGKLL